MKKNKILSFTINDPSRTTMKEFFTMLYSMTKNNGMPSSLAEVSFDVPVGEPAVFEVVLKNQNNAKVIL